ncbi:MAG: hypothetical protein HRF43_03265 [Phycisphaerae bacterium]
MFDVRLESGGAIRVPLDVSVVNGYLLEPFSKVPKTFVQVDGEPIVLKVRHARDDLESPTRTIVTLRDARNEQQGMSFVPAEAVRFGEIRVPSLGVTIRHRGSSASRPAASAAVTGRSVFDRVAAEPEQSFERARRELPELDPRAGLYIPLGPPLARQEIAVRYDGSTEINASALKVPADDGRPGRWRHLLQLRTGDPPVDQAAGGSITLRRLDGCLPVVIQTWQVSGVTYEQTSVATYLKGEPAQPRGDEEVVLLCRLKITNGAQTPRPAGLRLTWRPRTPMKPDEGLLIEDGFVRLAGPQPDRPGDYLYYAKGGFHAEPSAQGKPIDTLAWKDELGSGQEAVFEWRVPFGIPSKEKKPELAGLDFDRVVAHETDRWRKLLAQAAGFHVPDPLLNDFYKATLVNLWISADRDPFNGMEVLPAGTFGYNVCLNESCIQVRSLDRRGLHADARRYLDAMLRGQSTQGLHGRFTDKEGVFLGMPTQTGNYQTFNYNLDHGFTLWTLAEHYRFTRDRDWLARVAAALVAACDFVTRQAAWKPGSNTLTADDRYWGIGLLPPGHLEDPPEWLWWFAVNAYAWRGMQAAAEVLGEIGHPDAVRLAGEARSFGDNLRRSCKEAMIRAPVVRLRDGSYVPFQPTRSRLRGRDAGWIRDALYGPIHLIECGIYPPGSPEAEWILRDAEDNVFIGAERGYKLDDFEAQWFSWGGMTLQPNLLPVPAVYQDRGLRKHAVRAFYNTLCASVYADARSFAEWVPRPGTPGGPMFKPPDECAFVVWMRDLLIREHDDELDLLSGVPADWLRGGEPIVLTGAPTWFGPMDLRVTTRADGRELAVEYTGPTRHPPRWIRVHAGTPGRIRDVTLDGGRWTQFDAATGVIELPGKTAQARLVVTY